MKRFLTPFVLIFTSLLAGFYLYLGFRLADGPAMWAFLGLLFLLFWSLPVFHWSSDEDETTRLQLFFQQASFISMGLLSSIFVLTIARDIGLGLTSVLGGPERSLSLAAIWTPAATLALACALTAAGIWNALRGPKVREVQVPIESLPETLSGLRIAQISDLHVGPTIGESYVRRVVEQIQTLDPHLTVLTGDIVDGNIEDHRDAVAPLAKLGPQGRVFYSPGNHEYYWEFHQWHTEFERLGATVLLNEGAALVHNDHEIWIGGVTDPAAASSRAEDKPDPAKAAQGGERSALRILLSHRPGLASEAASAGFDLQLSGHTHGGQFFPWTLVAKLFHRYFVGLLRHERMWVYVSPGTGTWGPPVRLGTTPEITLLKLIRGAQTAGAR